MKTDEEFLEWLDAMNRLAETGLKMLEIRRKCMKLGDIRALMEGE